MSKPVYIVSVARTPIGSFQGALKSLSATQLGAIAIKGAVERAGIPADGVQEVFMGNVLQAGEGQAPARQAALNAGLSHSTPCTTVHKVCASGTKAIIFAAQSILLGDNDVVVAGGMESMSNAPYYLARGETPYGGINLKDSITDDGLLDSFYKLNMGECGERTAEKCALSRQDQDAYAKLSYERAAKAAAAGALAKEIVPVVIAGKRGKPDVTVSDDEEYSKVDFDKMATLKTVFKANGTITAANASGLADGAAACVLMSQAAVDKYGVKPLVQIISYGDGAADPVDFATAPSIAIPKAIEKAGLKTEDISSFEINEAFALVTLANAQKLGLSLDNVNKNGGAVSLGHPLGMSGCRVVNGLSLQLLSGQYGVACACNGGGGASAIVIKKL
ncbi:Acetyl-CoA acetyltransferase A, mitochondrial [Halotydeus destructor]|nr:Acetyl-CoA acetyltransferase A, mitochondrial [Halotydeus destructor]